MLEIVGQKKLKEQLLSNINNSRVPHAQVFNGKYGYGGLPLAINYAQKIIENSLPEKRKVNPLNHPDIHYYFPIVKNASSNQKSSKDYLNDWRNFIVNSAYGNIGEWHNQIGAGNKQGVIGADEAKDIVKCISLKSFSGGYKVIIIWGCERMNNSCANKLLKWIEEPTKNTTIILIAEKKESLLDTILSRCQIINVKPIDSKEIFNVLNKKNSADNSKKYASLAEGDFRKALHLIEKKGQEKVFEEFFVAWMRFCYRLKTEKKTVSNVLEWSDKISKLGREAKKEFLEYCMMVFRKSMLMNYGVSSLAKTEIKDNSFSLVKFAGFVNNINIEEIANEIEKAIFHIERNGNSKIIFTDLSFIMSDLLHKKTNNRKNQ